MSVSCKSEVEAQSAAPQLLPASFTFLSPAGIEALGVLLAHVAAEAAASATVERDLAREENSLLKDEIAALGARVAAREAKRAEIMADLLGVVARLSEPPEMEVAVPPFVPEACKPAEAQRCATVASDPESTPPSSMIDQPAKSEQPSGEIQALKPPRLSKPRLSRASTSAADQISLTIPAEALDAIDRIVGAGETPDRLSAVTLLIAEALKARANAGLATDSPREVVPHGTRCESEEGSNGLCESLAFNDTGSNSCGGQRVE